MRAGWLWAFPVEMRWNVDSDVAPTMFRLGRILTVDTNRLASI